MPHSPPLRSLSRACVLGALVAFAVPSLAAAQPVASPDAGAQPAADPARQQFEAGVAAMQRQDWTAALAAFEDSMRLRRSAAVALNLGVVLNNLGRLTEARARLLEFNELATAQQRGEHSAHVNELLMTLARRLARVRFIELSPPSAVVSIDGRRATLTETSEALFDPGAHTVRVEAPGYIPHEERVDVASSATHEMRVTLAAAPAPVVTPHPAQPPAPRAESPFYTRWWFWTTIGVVVVAGATVAVVRATAERDPPPTSTGIVLNGIRVGEGF